MFDVTHRSPLALVAMCLVPVAVLLLTPTIRPFRRWRLLFTDLLPILPLAIWWDGVVSRLRMYRPDVLPALAHSVPQSGTAWQAGEWRTPGQPLPLTYVIGTPLPRSTATPGTPSP